ncbi:MAG: hypothetical protein R1F54_09150 [Candidatus Zeuxoniibacter abyssi]|nr:MAG: hypothetical protein R1F54_09150 [Candidatus Persebacteraceae bacterium AB1(2)]
MIHHPLSFADTFCARFGVAPLFTNAVPGAIWRYFWPIMAAAFFLRVGVAVSSDWIYRIDETLEYLEQAHRLVLAMVLCLGNIVTVHATGWRSCRPLQR